MTRIHVAIAVVGDARSRLYEVATICRRLGFGHTSTNTDVGVLQGLAELEDLPALRAVPGVLAIEMEESRRFARLAPFDAGQDPHAGRPPPAPRGRTQRA